MAAPPIETERLLLRDYEPRDAEAAMVLHGDPEVMRFLGGVQHADAASLATWLEGICAKYDDYHARGLSYRAAAAIDRASGALIGTALFKPLPVIDAGGQRIDTEELEIGWHLARRAWGQGYASEMGRAMRELAFETTSIDVLHAVIDPGNVRSERVAERLGMRLVSTTDRFYGKTLQDFQLTRETWKERAR